MAGHRQTGGDWLQQADHLRPGVSEPSAGGGGAGGGGAGEDGGGRDVREK